MVAQVESGSREVDSELIDVCQEIVAGLDRNPVCLPQRLLQAFHGDKKKALEHAVFVATTPADDLIQNNRYWGGKDEKGTYSFGIFSKENERGFEICLTPDDARKIVVGELKTIQVKY